MTGFIRGFFGNNDKQIEAVPAQQANTEKREKAQAYFLEMDDARTMGDVDYMRAAKTVRRTFPKSAGGTEKEVIRQVSSTSEFLVDKLKSASTTPSITSSTPTASAQPQTTEGAERRRVDTNLDMFRSMAKEIRKR